MDVNPLEYAESDEEDSDALRKEQHRRNRLNTLVAITVALLATFMGVCKVKDDNIVQAMQQEQAKSVDTWAWYQFRKVRYEIFMSTADQMNLQALTAPLPLRGEFIKRAAAYRAQALEQQQKQDETRREAEGHDKKYDDLNTHDDQFDLSDASLSVAIALLAITSLTQKRWMYGVAMIPTLFGVVMGLAGLFEWGLHPTALTKLLS